MSRRSITAEQVSRRSFCRLAAATLTGVGIALPARSSNNKFGLKHILASSLYGRLPLEQVLEQASVVGFRHVDIWPEKHANHREQLEQMGHEKFRRMLEQHALKVGILTHYDLGPFGLRAEMDVVSELGASMIVSGSSGPAGLQGDDLRKTIAEFVEKMKPHVAIAEQMGITIAIENHSNSLIASPDSIRWFAEMVPSKRLGIALAPYHLPQDESLIADLITTMGPKLVHFYAWQHGTGCYKEQPKEQELLQMPGRGTLDFGPIVMALRQIGYKGWTEVFMHPFPRGIPIMPTASEVTAEVKRSKAYLQALSMPPRKSN